MWGKRKRDKRGKDKRIKIRQQFCCLIEEAELFELIPEGGGVLVVTGFFCGGGIVFDEPGEELGVVDFVAEHLFAALSARFFLF